MSDADRPAPILPAGAPGTRRGWRCPDEARLASFVEGKLPAAARDGLEAHLADCAFCLGQVGFLSRAAKLGPPPAVPVHLLAAARGERGRLLVPFRPARLLAATAGLVLALLAGTHGPGSRGVGGPGLEDGAAGPSHEVRTVPGAAASPRLLVPAEGAILPRSGLELGWRETPDALFYTVQVVDADGDVVWEGRTEGTRLAVPPTAPLAPGRPYFAWVLAHLRSGATVPSPAVGFRLTPG